MRGRLLGLVLILHALAHANAGMLAADQARVMPTILWAIAVVGLLAGGFGCAGVRRLERQWRTFAMTGIAASALLLLGWRPPTAGVGLAFDVLLLATIARVTTARTDPAPLRAGRWRAVGAAVIYTFIAGVGVAILTRPWHMRWGSSRAELVATLPGDDLVPVAHYTIQHAVTIDAPPAAVWPWLVQLGQDKGGFYSYDWLERLVGDDIHNADSINLAWQGLREGDLVRAVQPDYLGGAFGRDVGWRVTRLDPERLLVLDKWGAFILQPHGDSGTRLIVRTRGDQPPSLASVALAPFGMLVFEPAHFIMQRRMLLGIKERAEQHPQWRS